MAVLALLIAWAMPSDAALSDGERAGISKQLSAVEQSIYMDPVRGYAQVMAMDARIPAEETALRLGWYLRRAQAENLLYRYDEFEHSIDAAEKLLGPDNGSALAAWVHMYRCVIMQRAARYGDADTCFDAALDIARRHGDGRAEVYILQERAYSDSLDERFSPALDELLVAYRLAIQSEDPFLLGIVEETYGAVYGYLEDYAKSIEHYSTALELYRKLGYRTFIAEALYGLASTYRYQGNYDEALSHYLQFRDVFRDNESVHFKFLAEYGLGMTYAQSGDCPRSLEAIARAVALDGPADYKAELYKKQAGCLLSDGRVADARAAVERAREMYGRTPDLSGTSWELELQKIDAQVTAAEGRYRQAYAILGRFHEEYAKRQEATDAEQLAQLRAGLESRRKDMEIARMRERNEKDAIELHRQRQKMELQSYVSLLWIALVILALLFVLWQRRTARRFRELSLRDPLTRLYNRRHVFALLRELAGRSVPGKTELSVIVMDIDDFKRINDLYGHAAGDRVLRTLAEVSAGILRQSDTLARIGGEEFLIVLPREGRDETLVVAERIRAAVEDARVPLSDGREIRFTVSLGVARYSPECVDAESLFTNADHALYAAKAAGKNRVEEYRPQS